MIRHYMGMPALGGGDDNLSPALQAVLLEMHAAPFTFHLGGSHYFGCARSDSDWDFIAEESGALERWLGEHGFGPMSHGEYEGFDLVWEHATEKVQVSCTPYLKEKLIARDVLAGHFSHEHRLANKAARNAAWTCLIDALVDVGHHLNGTAHDYRLF